MTATTSTYLVVGTDPAGATLTQTVTHVTTVPAGPDGLALQAGVPVAGLDPEIQGQTIDGILCNRINELAYQSYSYLQIEDRGAPRALPGGIGLVQPRPSSGTTTTYHQSLCGYWLRTTAANGLIEALSPVRRHYTLGEFFDIWGQPLSRHEVAGLRGRVTAIVDGHRWAGSPRTIPLREHTVIELAVGRPTPHAPRVDWAVTNL